MAGSNRQGKPSPDGGQRRNLSSPSGQKSRSPTSQPHKGSRVDPSHVTEQARESRVQKVKTQAARKAAKKKG